MMGRLLCCTPLWPAESNPALSLFEATSCASRSSRMANQEHVGESRTLTHGRSLNLEPAFEQ
jgi:hypothetical protein